MGYVLGHLLGFPGLATGVAVLAVILPLLAWRSGRARTRWRRAAASPLALAGVGLGILLTAGVTLVRNYVHFLAWLTARNETPMYWRPSYHDVEHARGALDIVVAQETAAALAVVICAVAAIVSAWSRGRDTPTSARVTALLVASALALPVLAGAVAVLAVLASFSGAWVDSVWQAWHTAEAARWGVLGLSVCAIVAASPIVIAAAERGQLVDVRTYRAAQVLLGVSVLVWSCSQLVAADIQQGPLAQWEARAADPGSARWHNGVAMPFLSAPTSPSADPLGDSMLIELPIVDCLSPTMMNTLKVAAPLDIDISTTALSKPARRRAAKAWAAEAKSAIARQAEGELNRHVVVVAAIDRRIPGDHLEPYLRELAEFADAVAVVAASVERPRTVLSGAVQRSHACIAVVLPTDQTQSMQHSNLRWGTLVNAAAADQNHGNSVGARRVASED